MKQMFKSLFLFLLLLLGKNNFAQVSAIPYYDHLNFNNAFFVIAEKDDKSNYYAVNLTLFNSTFEKKYFENLAFNEPRLIRLDGGNSSIAWFRAQTFFPEQEINALLAELKNKTFLKNATMNDSEKIGWLNRNNK
jgi:hypothetical protein